VSRAPIDSILFVGFGGPTGPGDILPFLRTVVAGRGVPEERLREVEHHYLEVGGRSPYNMRTEEQRAAVEAWLRARGIGLPLYTGMRNWHPWMKDTIARMNDDGCRHAIGVILAAHRSEASWERYQADVAAGIAAQGGRGPEVTYLDPWYDHPRFLEANAQLIEAATGQKRGAWPAALPVLFTAHSIPTAMAGAERYVQDLEASCAGVARILGASDWELCWQSRSGDPRTPWLEPDVNDVLSRRASAATREVVVQAIGFLSDHVEVLYDLDLEAKRTAEGLGMRLLRARCVNDHPEFIAMLGELIAARLARDGAATAKAP
jgi:protoporphyrin/coproporphyrin ferrochelatase